MPITDILERNCKLYGNDICLVDKTCHMEGI